MEFTPPTPEFSELGRGHEHVFRRLARTIAPPTDVFDCIVEGCEQRRRYLMGELGDASLLPEVRGSGAASALDWTYIQRGGSLTQWLAYHERGTK